MSNTFGVYAEEDGLYMLWIRARPIVKMTEQDVIRLAKELLNSLQVTADLRERRELKDVPDAQ